MCPFHALHVVLVLSFLKYAGDWLSDYCTPARGWVRAIFWLEPRNPRSDERDYCGFGGYFSIDFFTMSSSLASTLAASLFSSRAMARQTRERVVGSRRSSTSVPSV